MNTVLFRLYCAVLDQFLFLRTAFLAGPFADSDPSFPNLHATGTLVSHGSFLFWKSGGSPQKAVQ